MRDEIIEFHQDEKSPVFGVLTLASGTWSNVVQGTYTLKDNSGASVANGNVDGSTNSALTLTEWKTLDGTSLSLLPGLYPLVFSLGATASDTIARRKTPNLLLWVPGDVADATYYATGDDLQLFLASSGVISNPPTDAQKLLDLDGAMNAASDLFERLTGFSPFLYGGAVTTRKFRSEGNIVKFDDGLIALDAGADVITAGSATFTNDSNVQLMPLNAAARGRPYTYLKFLTQNSWAYSPLVYTPSDSNAGPGIVGGRTNTVSVRGKWGYSLTITPRVKNALLCLGALRLSARLSLLYKGGVKSWKSGTTEEENFEMPLKQQIALWQMDADEVIHNINPAYDPKQGK